MTRDRAEREAGGRIDLSASVSRHGGSRGNGWSSASTRESSVQRGERERPGKPLPL